MRKQPRPGACQKKNWFIYLQSFPKSHQPVWPSGKALHLYLILIGGYAAIPRSIRGTGSTYISFLRSIRGYERSYEQLLRPAARHLSAFVSPELLFGCREPAYKLTTCIRFHKAKGLSKRTRNPEVRAISVRFFRRTLASGIRGSVEPSVDEARSKRDVRGFLSTGTQVRTISAPSCSFRSRWRKFDLTSR